jgi:serine/threonine protein kinase
VLYLACLLHSSRDFFSCSGLSREVVRMPLEGLHLGHYHLLRLIGSGGMGEVYLAEDARIGQQVAIKVIRTEGIAYPGSESATEATRLFEREAKAIARLDHPNILPLYAYGEETLHDTQLTYLVMPYRKEGTLVSWLRLRGNAAPLSPTEVAPLLQQAAEALQHAHTQHILHQDIKPSNFLIRVREEHPNRPDLLLSDFGIAKLTSATASASQSIRGTPTYMAPEQWDGHPVAASDQYALAIMVYELLVGRPPFVGNSAQVMRQHYMAPPPVPSSLNASLSTAIDAVLVRALSKQPEERFPSVSAFARAFGEAVQSDGELQATLAISQAEAETGTVRNLTLPGGRQVSVTVPAGVSDGTALRLDGQGMPYYEGGPSGPLVLTIAISAEARPPLQPQDSTDPTVAMSLPNEELLSVEDPNVSPALSEAPEELEPTVPASYESETASTVLATDATSLPTEEATPTPQAPLPVQLARSVTPPAIQPVPKVVVKPAKPVKRSTWWLAIIVIGIIALVVGVLYQVQALGYHPTRAIACIAAGVILLIIGIAGMMVTRHTALMQLQQVAAIPSRPKARTAWNSWIISTLVGITIFGVATFLSDLVYWNVISSNSNSPLINPIIPNWYGPIWAGLIVGWSLVVPFFFGARFGPWVGLCTAIIGSFLGDVIWGYFFGRFSIDDFIVLPYYGIPLLNIGWYWYVAIAACGFFPGLAYRRSRGRNLSIRAALLFSLLGMSMYYIIGTIVSWFYYNIATSGYHLPQVPISYVFQYVITSMLASLSALLFLLIALSVSNALA